MDEDLTEEEFRALTVKVVANDYYKRLSWYGKFLYHVELNTYKIMLLLFLLGVYLGKQFPF